MEKIDDLTFNAMYSLLQGGMWLLNDLETFLKPYDLSQGRLAILLAVQESSDGEISPMHIANITGKSRPTITKMIEKLKSAGLITIEADSSDARQKRLMLTKKGKELLNEIIPGYNSRLNEMSHLLTKNDKESLIEVIQKIDFLNKNRKLEFK